MLYYFGADSLLFSRSLKGSFRGTFHWLSGKRVPERRHSKFRLLSKLFKPAACGCNNALYITA